MTARRLAAPLLTIPATAALHAQPAACTAEWAKLANTHAATRAALDASSKSQWRWTSANDS